MRQPLGPDSLLGPRPLVFTLPPIRGVADPFMHTMAHQAAAQSVIESIGSTNAMPAGLDPKRACIHVRRLVIS